MKSVTIFGVRVDDVTCEEALDIIDGFVNSGSPHHVITTNTEHAVSARKDEVFRQVLNATPLAVPDGSGLLLASRLFGHPLRQHVTGTDLSYGLVALAAERGYRVFLLGGAPGVAEQAAAKLKVRHPQLVVAGTYAGSPRSEDEDEVIGRVRAAGPVDILFVAYGSPAQEKWIARNLDRLSTPVAIGIGGAFDFFAGRVPRAPQWMRDLHLEWLYRLIKQPWRWRRQLALPHFLLLLLIARLRSVFRPGRDFVVSTVGDSAHNHDDNHAHGQQSR